MKKFFKRVFKRNITYFIMNMIVFIIYTIINISFIKTILKFNGIENILRYSGIIFLIIINILFLFFNLKYIVNIKKLKCLILLIVMTILNVLFFYLSYNINKVLDSVSNLNKKTVTYTSNMVIMKDKNITINDIKDMKIGVLSDKNNYNGYVIPYMILEENNLIKNNEIVLYESFINIINDLYEGKVDVGFFPSTYRETYVSIDRFSKIYDETVILTSKSKEYENVNKTTSSKKLTEPFTLLLLGIDSEEDNINTTTAFNGDSIILLTFNPSTLNTTMLSIPRDTYVPVACFKNKYENKITHAAWGGETCMEQTIEDLTGINIDYYVKVNFKGVVNLVNALNGIDIDVPYNFCEQDSKRRFGKHMIFVDKGFQTLNGEEALALARHRKEDDYMASYCGKKYIGNKVNDIVRGQMQVEIIKSILNKLKTIRSVEMLYDILDAINNSVDTNITINQILSLYDVFKDVVLGNDTNQAFGINKLYLKGYDQYIYDEEMGLTLYNYIYYRGSLEDDVTAMKVNLGLEKQQMIKKFSFSINQEYEIPVIGNGDYKIVDYIKTLPNFIGKTKDDVTEWAENNNFTINYVYLESDEKENTIIEQDYPYGYRVLNIKNKELTITISKKKQEEIIYYDCTLKLNEEKNACLLPDFTGMSLSKFNTWYNNLSKYNIFIPTPVKTIIEVDDAKYDEEKKGEIISQSKEPKLLLKDIVSLEIEYIEE